MKKKQLLLWVAVCFLLASCGKANKNHVSTWYINGKKYKTKEVNGYQYSDEAYLTFTGTLNGDDIALGMSFFLNDFPKSGSFDVLYEWVSSKASIGFTLNGTQYLVSKENNTVVRAYSNDNKGKYVIEPVWLYGRIPDSTNTYYIMTGDSVLFSGELYEPEEVYSRL